MLEAQGFFANHLRWSLSFFKSPATGRMIGGRAL